MFSFKNVLCFEIHNETAETEQTDNNNYTDIFGVH